MKTTLAECYEKHEKWGYVSVSFTGRFDDKGMLVELPLSADITPGQKIVHDWIGSWVFRVGRVPEIWYVDLAKMIDATIEAASSASMIGSTDK